MLRSPRVCTQHQGQDAKFCHNPIPLSQTVACHSKRTKTEIAKQSHFSPRELYIGKPETGAGNMGNCLVAIHGVVNQVLGRCRSGLHAALRGLSEGIDWTCYLLANASPISFATGMRVECVQRRFVTPIDCSFYQVPLEVAKWGLVLGSRVCDVIADEDSIADGVNMSDGVFHIHRSTPPGGRAEPGGPSHMWVYRIEASQM